MFTHVKTWFRNVLVISKHNQDISRLDSDTQYVSSFDWRCSEVFHMCSRHAQTCSDMSWYIGVCFKHDQNISRIVQASSKHLKTWFHHVQTSQSISNMSRHASDMSQRNTDMFETW